METSKKEGYIAGGVFLLIGLIIVVPGFRSGWESGYVSIILGGAMSILGIGGLIKPDIVGDILAHWMKNQANNSSQNMNNSPKSIQQRAGRDATIKQIDNRGAIINNFKNKDFSTRKERNKIKEEEALRKIRAKMIYAMKLVNDSANIGVQSETKFEEVKKAVKDFIEIKMEYEIDIDKEMIDKFNQAMGALREAEHALYINLGSKKLNEPLRGLNSFGFIDKVNEADILVKQRLIQES